MDMYIVHISVTLAVMCLHDGENELTTIEEILAGKNENDCLTRAPFSCLLYDVKLPKNLVVNAMVKSQRLF